MGRNAMACSPEIAPPMPQPPDRLDSFAGLTEQLAAARAGDRPPALQLGDRCPSPPASVWATEWGRRIQYRIQAADCPDCEQRFVAAMAEVRHRLEGMTDRRAERWERPRWKRRGRCSICAKERLRLQHRQAEQRYRDRRRQALEQHCSHCGVLFYPQRRTARFCCTTCRVASHRAAAHPPIG